MRFRALMMTALVGLGVTTVMAGCKSTADVLNVGDAATKQNAGACPRAFAIYDAARIVEFRGEAEAFANVGFTGEIANVRSLCRYYNAEPITGDIEITFDFGRGPAATQNTATYEYFVAIMRKNIAVMNKETFPLQVTFPAGADRVRVTEKIDNFTIPRATETTSGENFEIVVGFELTSKQRQFNAEGRRFRISAGQN
ncbi:hypothetical protein DES40_2057 [Litorimonas taeanensis]|uniref:Lipoprotein n=2 Tax=Litorimonas taeanensis TaxID=568099 RepID=A0A420WE46_9PROT|nr:hypothetical protein DES40_2057 [Litorimonas taeanensis]